MEDQLACRQALFSSRCFEVEPGRFEIVPDQAQAEQPAAEGVLGVIRGHRAVGGGPLGQGRVAHGQAELDVRLEFSGSLCTLASWR